MPNALRGVVVACSLDAPSPEMDLTLPTYVLLTAEESGVGSALVASPASPFTLPKNALVEREGGLARRTQGRVDEALRLVFGYRDWPA